MLMRHLRLLWGAAPAAFLLLPLALGCEHGPTQVDESLSVRLDVTPATVAPGDSLVARLTLTNTDGAPVELSSPNGCLALPEVHRGGTPIRIQGTALGCFAALTTHVVPARDSLVREFRLRAAVDADQYIEPVDTTLAEGVYELWMNFQVFLPDPVAVFTVALP